ncbi:hypothetical protein C8Q80DRAFT_1213611 [Daedaleopsis nitida]|nr:hypothetical protein C8Q80DRAFT_1214938 [Daedaleopsis nitida]KAI0737319.1 hypothetical protein C8Q80DRAFT_1213611 [Daedaleopsis nitida]
MTAFAHSTAHRSRHSGRLATRQHTNHQQCLATSAKVSLLVAARPQRDTPSTESRPARRTLTASAFTGASAARRLRAPSIRARDASRMRPTACPRLLRL